MKIFCGHCLARNYRKNGFVHKIQRYFCKNCERNFTMKPKRYSEKMRMYAVFLYLNNSGIRKTARFLNVSPSTILRWLRWAHKKFCNKNSLSNEQLSALIKEELGDIIER
jgi:transposase-like protein